MSEEARLRALLAIADGELARLHAYVTAIERSKSWRALQALRALVGRRWPEAKERDRAIHELHARLQPEMRPAEITDVLEELWTRTCSGKQP